MSGPVRLALWRLSVLVAAALAAASLWLAYELAQIVLLLSGVADYLGRPEAMQWGSVALSFVTLGLLGLLLPALYICWAWPRAFRRSAH